MQVGSLGQEDPLEESMATHSSILAWRIPMDKNTWCLQPKGSPRVRPWLKQLNSIHPRPCLPLDFHASPNLLDSVQFSLSVMSNSLQLHGLQHARLPCSSPTPRVYLNSCPLTLWCHPTITFSVVPFSSHLQSFIASGSFPMSQSFTSDGQSIGVSTLPSVLPKNTQDWSPLEWTGWISLQSNGLSRVFSNTTVQKHKFFSAQLSLYSNSHTYTWLLEKP